MNFTWQGQSCGSTSRLLVHASIYDDFVDRLAARVDELRPGPPVDPATDTGAIVTLQLDKVALLRRDRQGARGPAGERRRLTAGPRAWPLRHPPAVRRRGPGTRRSRTKRSSTRCWPTIPFADYDEALPIANSVRYGLTASVFTDDLGPRMAFARDVRSRLRLGQRRFRHFTGYPLRRRQRQRLRARGGHRGTQSYAAQERQHPLLMATAKLGLSRGMRLLWPPATW